MLILQYDEQFCKEACCQMSKRMKALKGSN